MKKILQNFRILIVCALELTACILILYGLWLIWDPLFWIFSGVLLLLLGSAEYRVWEESRK